MSRLASVLRALADLAPGDTSDAVLWDVTGGGDQPFAWLGDHVDPHPVFSQTHPRIAPLPWRREERAIDRLRAQDALHREERLLRAGWLFLCGPTRVGSTTRNVCTPLLERPVRIGFQLGQAVLDPIGDPELVLPADRRTAAIQHPFAEIDPPPPPPPTPKPGIDLVLEVVFGQTSVSIAPPRRTAGELAHDPRLVSWVQQVVAAAGLPPVARVLADPKGLGRARAGSELVVVVGTGLYLAEPPRVTAGRGSLLEWAERRGIDRTALAHLYGLGGHDDQVPRPGDPDVPQPLPLTVAQADAIARARNEHITVVSGAPGNGKSHLVCAAAIDAVAQGRSVLVTTPTEHAADVLGELLDRQPGPTPIMFGSTAGRRRMIEALEAATPVPGREVDRLRQVAMHATEERRRAERVVLGALERELRATRADRWTAQLPELRAAVPGVFAPGADLAEVGRRVDALQARPSWWRRRRLRSLVGCAPIVGVDAVAAAVLAAADVRAQLELDTVGGTSLGAAWDVLLSAEAAERAAEGRLVDALARHEDRWRGAGRRAVAGLLAALPAGRAVRRAALDVIDADALVRAVPLWVGTLRDVEDLLPARPGLFDLVIVDEAAQVDQFRAAGALLRADRAVVVGDPRQLRHVSFVADVDVAAALARHGVGDLADRLDVRRQSLFDVAAGASAVTFLDEHFRSVPHLIDFSARRFYGGRIRVATRNPVNEAEDAIDVVRAPDVPGEVAVVVDLVARLVADGVVGIGAITPFRAHADAIEAAIIDRFDPEVIEAHGLRTGTAHAAQGSERDHLVVALGLAVDDPPARWRFAEDPNLFNVLVTRGRRRVTIVTSLPERGFRPGIVADYLRHADHPPAAPTTAPATTPWVDELAAELERNGVAVRVGYPVGRWTVDICAGTGGSAVALDCAVHPDGPAAHVERHRGLRRAGWRVVDAFPSRWEGDAAAAAVELATEFRGGGGPP